MATDTEAAIRAYLERMAEIRGTGGATKETSYYGALENLLNTLGARLKPAVICNGQLRDQGAGHPDFGLYTKTQCAKGAPKPGQGEIPERGVIEVKGLADNSWQTAHGSQATKYLPLGVTDDVNHQDPDTFTGEAKRIVKLTKTIEWRQPSRHEMSGEEADMAEADAEVIIEEDAGKPEIQGGPLRGTILHKLMEEAISGEIDKDLSAVETRSAELLDQLGEIPAEDSAKGLVPAELAQLVIQTLDLPEISSLRDHLHSEFTVFGDSTESGPPQKEFALSGVTDAVALGGNGDIEIVVDWKSDVAPTTKQRDKYQAQVRDYLEACGAERGLIVYMTLGQVDEIRA